MADPASYTVGWICALPVEYIAAQEFLDEEHGRPKFVSPNDSNDYTLGKIWDHNVVIAVMPDGEYGTASAANVATNMLSSFHNIRIGLMVGIGGGVPSKRHDIRLGDVVVSASRGDSGGVFQYDFGKSIQNQEFQHTRFLNQPPAILRAAVAGLRTQYERAGHQLNEAIEDILTNNKRLRRKYKRPSTTDQLFQSDMVHKLACGDSSCIEDVSNCIMRDERIQDDDDDPAIHYGLIASGNQLMKDALIRDKFATAKDVLCFEMEAAGLMNTFPCLVIRGICDYSDSHKNDKWHGYAAMVAAGYAKDLLKRIALKQVEAEKRISTLISDQLKTTNELLQQSHIQNQQSQVQNEKHHREIISNALTEKQLSCHQSFKISNYEEQKNINPKWVEGTCQWALQSSEFTRWWETSSSDLHTNLLWISADPGCGKSVLARSIIDEFIPDSGLKSNPGLQVVSCYFFFKDNDQQNSLAIGLCALLHQIFSQRPDLVQYAVPSWERTGAKFQNEVSELWRILIEAKSAAKCPVVCILDALDECRENDQRQLIERLNEHYLQQRSSSDDDCLKFLVTSRPYHHLHEGFRPVTDKFPNLRLKGEEENDQISQEINLVVNVRVKELARAATLSDDVQQHLETQLLQMKHRTYLWLYLAIDDIRSTFENSFQPTKETIERIPPSVNEAYEKILGRVPFSQKETVKKILQIIVGARRPLTTSEMAIALGIYLSPQSRKIADAALDPVQIETKIRRVCGLFVFINNSKIYLIHQTAREFLIGKAGSGIADFASAYSCTLSDTELQMAAICTKFLLMEDLETLQDLKDTEDESGSTSQTFLKYSARYWPDHVRDMPSISDEESRQRLDELHDVSTTRFALWFEVLWKELDISIMIPRPKMTALHLTAFNGHAQQMNLILAAEGGNVNIPDDQGSDPLMWASFRGHEDVVEILLEQGADVNVQGGRHGNALQIACKNGNRKIVDMILDRGANVLSKGGVNGNSFAAACSSGHIEIAQTLLARGADFTIQGESCNIALQIACEYGKDKLVDILLEQGADINSQSGDLGTNLQAACVRGHDKTVRMLLHRGANVNAQGGELGNALQAACYWGREKIVQMLIHAGAEINAQGGKCGNALIAACFNTSGEREKVAQMLLEGGADCQPQDKDHRSALWYCCLNGFDRVAEMLLDRGAEINVQYGDKGNCLHAACIWGRYRIAQMLLDRGANLHAHGGWYGNALQAACVNGYSKTAGMLLDQGADINAQGGKFGSALQAACFSGPRNETTLMLLDRGADINIRGGYYGCALQALAVRGYHKTIRILLDRGADPNIQGGHYGNALQTACAGGFYKTAQILLDRGADVNAQGGEFGNAFQAACRRGGNDKLVRMLIDRGANVHALGGPHGTLQAASMRGNKKIAQTLIEQGADLLIEDKDGMTPIITAARYDHLDMVKLLIMNGADIHLTNRDGYGPLHAASAAGNLTICRFLVDNDANTGKVNKDGQTPLHRAAYNGHFGVCDFLLKRNARLGLLDHLGRSPAHLAAGRGHKAVVELLYRYGADINLTDEHGWMPLHAASAAGCLEVCRFLVDNDTKIDHGNKAGWTPLHEAAYHGHFRVCDLLLKRNAQLGLLDHLGRSPAHLAAGRGHKTVVELLSRYGADMNLTDKHGWTPLHAASATGRLEVCLFLVDIDTRMNNGNKDGWTPLHEAAYHGHFEVCGLLLKRDAQPRPLDHLGRSPSYLATGRGHKAIVELLSRYEADDSTVDDVD
ncbi:unnamed protein product [Penicillium salamii]|nr:unnamed protein product [Penicillium salamii]